MTIHPIQRQIPPPKKAVIRWLLDGDPAIRWQVMRDLSKEPEEVIAAERSRVALEGWGAQLLARQAPDGLWGDGMHAPWWQSTLAAPKSPPRSSQLPDGRPGGHSQPLEHAARLARAGVVFSIAHRHPLRVKRQR